jgi:hypothetical protein
MSSQTRREVSGPAALSEAGRERRVALDKLVLLLVVQGRPARRVGEV